MNKNGTYMTATDVKVLAQELARDQFLRAKREEASVRRQHAASDFPNRHERRRAAALKAAK
jgi:hypothetical protein